MKKSCLSFAILTALLTSQAYAADGTISFTGNIQESTCTVTGGTGSVAGSKDISVTMPNISTDVLANDGDVAGETPFSIVIGGKDDTGCANGLIASLHFESQKSALIDPATGNLNNQVGVNYAENVQIELLNDDGQKIDLYNSDNVSFATVDGHTATLSFTARYKANGGAVKPGLVDTNLVYSVTYK